MRNDPERIAENEDTFRKRNDMLRVGQVRREELLLLCECGSTDCTGTIRMSIEEYETLRGNPRRFAVVRGHEFPDVERVVERHAAHDVVEKTNGGEEAARLDQR